MTNDQGKMTNNQICDQKGEPLIELKGISKSFGDKVILDKVDLTVYRGDALVIIGPSGTGKSTILRIMAGLLAPDEGEVYVLGKKREGLIEDCADPLGISMVFQHSALFDSLTVDENVGFSVYQHSKLPKDKIRQLVEEKLDMVGVPNTADLYPAELSGGMQRRVSFARAIMTNPDESDQDPGVILYDEPTAGLDPIASTVIENLVRRLQQSPQLCGTYVMVTHQDSTIRHTADRIIFLYGGKVQWEGQVSEIETTDNPIVQQFFQAKTEGPIKVTSLD